MSKMASLPKRRPFVSCIRHFPKGCGPPSAVADDREPINDAFSPAPRRPLPPPGGIEELGNCNQKPPSPTANGVLNAPLLMAVAEADEKASVVVSGAESSTGSVKASEEEGSESAGSSEYVGRKVEEHSTRGGIPTAENKQFENLEPANADSVGAGAEGAGPVIRMEVDAVGGNVFCSKLYPPPTRRAVSAVREFPVGCGPSEDRIELKKVVVESAKVNEGGDAHVPESKKLKLEAGQAGVSEVRAIKPDKINIETVQPAVSEAQISSRLTSPKSKSLALCKKSMVEQPVAMQETLMEEQSKKNVLVNIAPEDQIVSLPSSPKTKSLDAHKQPTMKQAVTIQDDFLEDFGNKKMLANPVAEKLEEQAMRQANNNLQIEEEERSKPSSPEGGTHSTSIPIDKERKTSASKSTNKLVEKLQIVKRKFSDKVNDKHHGRSDQNLDANSGKTIVQALMAAPNCPWRQGKKLGASGSRSVVSKATVTRNRTPRSKQLALIEKKDEEDSSPQYEEDERPFLAIQGLNELSVTIYPVAPSMHLSGSGSKDEARHKVRRALRLFQAVCRKLLQGEEANSKGSKKLKRNDTTTNSKGSRTRNRIDLNAAGILKAQGQWVNTGKAIIGVVPGVEVGDEFQYRAELAIVGLHRSFQAGIDKILNDSGVYVATSVVASGGYQDDMDSSDVLIYSGSGGMPAGKDKPPEDQKLEHGNLALKNSILANTPVRVIHGFKEAKSNPWSHDTRPKLVSTFTYAGLYFVEEYWQEKGPHGFLVYKFKLRRLPGQPELALQEVKRSKKSKVREGLCVEDISEGHEKIPICAINTVNNEHPAPFKYITKNMYPSWFAQTPPKGCDCTNGCSDSQKCACAIKNGGEIPFNFNGAIVQAKPLVYECGPSCKCPPSCHNRVSQRGIRIPLEIFKTRSRGWGVRSLYSIPSGSFVCEYIGELLREKEAEQRSNDEYLFDIGHNYDDQSLWEGLPCLIVGLESSSRCQTVEDVGFTIDAAEYGNVGRFINHSCSPNLYAQNLLYDHDDKRIPHIMFFAAENIPPLTELSYHYNYAVDQVRDAEGNIKRKNCHCGSVECRGRLY